MTSIENKTVDLEKLAQTHYENFPVASFLLAKNIRTDIRILYAFARISDDIADHPTLDKSDKYAQLRRMQSYVDGCENEFSYRLNEIIQKYPLNKAYFYDLLSAFNQDVENNMVNTWNELEDYARRSANPIGRLMLEMHGIHNKSALDYSDSICSALQFINFWQDLSVDKMMNRLYVPLEILDYYQLDCDSFYFAAVDNRHSLVLKDLILRTKEKLTSGHGILDYLSGRLYYEIKWILIQAWMILEIIEKKQTLLLSERPFLSKSKQFVSLVKLALKIPH